MREEREEIIRAEHLSFSYGPVKAVRDVSFSVQEGEIAAVIGPNGSGKTTTVECLEGLKSPASGTVRVFGMDPWVQRKDVYRKMGVQLQTAEYPPRIRVGELCRLFASFYERPADWELLLRELRLDGKQKQTVQKLSGGEKQKLSIVLSLMGRPKVLILDELTTGLDPEARQGIRDWMARMKKSGIGMILVSHYLDEIEALADRILFLQDGTQRFWGTQAEFIAYAKSQIPEERWPRDASLEKWYLMLNPEQQAMTMEGIL